jgi:uncharacterized lipoprotein YmbA
MIRRRPLLAAILAGASLLPACTTTPKADFYTLDTGDRVSSGTRSQLIVAIGPVDLPQYLDRPHIVSRTGGNRLRVDEFNRWAGSLEEDVTRVLTRRVGDRLGTLRVYGYPSRVVVDTDYRVAVDVRAFDGTLGGEVVLEASWAVLDDRAGRVVQTRQANYSGVAQGDGYDAYAAALSALLGQLGDDLAAVIGDLPSPGG